ncbi:hypothetical protein K435DRAFT_774947, partial [Dendrothele bispora CBS 962.96]
MEANEKKKKLISSVHEHSDISVAVAFFHQLFRQLLHQISAHKCPCSSPQRFPLPAVSFSISFSASFPASFPVSFSVSFSVSVSSPVNLSVRFSFRFYVKCSLSFPSTFRDNFCHI